MGPLVIAGVSVSTLALNGLRDIGVTDSKQLTAKKRQELYASILAVSDAVCWVYIYPPKIDEYVKNGTRRRKLNFLEAVHMAEVIGALGTDSVYVDAPDTNLPLFSSELAEMLDPCPQIVAEHRADVNYVVVSAASIVAKVERDRAVEKLRNVHGDFGSGYPHDARTISYLKEYVRREGMKPPFARKSWKTWERILVDTLDVQLA